MKVCIAGYGSIGKRHHEILKSLLHQDSEFTICDVNFGAKIEEVCQSNFDIVLVCTDTISHVDVALKFESVNQILFIEKPLSFSSEDSRRLEDHPAKDKIHVGCNIRFTPFYEKIKKASQGIRSASIVSMSHLPSWRPGTNHLDSYSANLHLGGGVLLDFIHEPDYVASIFGLPEKVMISNRKIFNSLTRDAPDTCSMIWEYEDKTFTFTLCYGSKEYSRNFTCVDSIGKSSIFEIDLAEFRSGYEPQWKHILEHGPTNRYNNCVSLLKILEL
jgi:predicted dehydrogenase